MTKKVVTFVPRAEQTEDHIVPPFPHFPINQDRRSKYKGLYCGFKFKCLKALQGCTPGEFSLFSRSEKRVPCSACRPSSVKQICLNTVQLIYVCMGRMARISCISIHVLLVSSAR